MRPPPARAYAETLANRIAGPTTIRIIAGAGHLAELDKPVEVATAMAGFLAGV